jgi:hypothetical protein
MTERDINKLNEIIEANSFVLDRDLYLQLIKAKLTRLQHSMRITEFATKLQKSQD